MVDFQTALAFHRELDVHGFERAMHVLDQALFLNNEQPLVVTILTNRQIEVNLLTEPIPYATFRRLLGY